MDDARTRLRLLKTLPPVHVRLRRKLCATCPTQCDYFTSGKLVLEDAAERCGLPEPRWTSDERAAKTFGLGDAVAFVAKPIAIGVDYVAGTDLQHCIPCQKKQAFLNKTLPDITHPFSKPK